MPSSRRRSPSPVLFAILFLPFGATAGFVLDVIGKGAAATKYNIFASLSNLPIYLMGVLDGWVSNSYGRVTMLWFDGTAGIVGAALLLLLVFAVRPRRQVVPAPSPIVEG